MRKLVLLGLFIYLFHGVANAQTLTVLGSRGQTTIYSYSERRPAVTFYRDDRTPEERATREAAWSKRCRPTLSVPDDLGVQRYVYAQRGCEFGD